MKESGGKEVEVELACEVQTGGLCRKEGDGNESTRKRWLDRMRGDIKDMGLSGRKCTTELHGGV